MKKTNMFKFFGLMTIIGSLVFMSCSKEGPAGPAGPAGATGATGAAGPSAKYYDFPLVFDSSSATFDVNGNLTALGGNYQTYGGISGVDTVKDIVLLYEKYTSPTTGTNFYTAMPYVSNLSNLAITYSIALSNLGYSWSGLAYNFTYYRKRTSTTGEIYIDVSIEDPNDCIINPINITALDDPQNDIVYPDNFRAVVIKGMAGKNANVNYADYNSVKAYFNLKD